MTTKRVLKFSVSVVVAGLALVPLAMLAKRTPGVGIAWAQSQEACTLETLKGTYLFHGEGVTMNEGKVVPYAEAGVWTFDGKGSTEGVISASMNGEAWVSRQATTTTYEHVGNCVYAVVDDLGFQVDLYTTPTGTPMTYYAAGFSGIQLKQER